MRGDQNESGNVVILKPMKLPKQMNVKGFYLFLQSQVHKTLSLSSTDMQSTVLLIIFHIKHLKGLQGIKMSINTNICLHLFTIKFNSLYYKLLWCLFFYYL